MTSMNAHPNSQMGQLQAALRAHQADITALHQRYTNLSALIVPATPPPVGGPTRGVLRLDPFASDKDAAEFTVGQATYKSLLEATEYELTQVTPRRDGVQKELKVLYAQVMGLQKIVDEPITAPPREVPHPVRGPDDSPLLPTQPVASIRRQQLRQKSAALAILELLGDPDRAAAARSQVEALIAEEAKRTKVEYKIAVDSVQDVTQVREERLADATREAETHRNQLSVALSKGTESGRPPVRRE